MCNQGIFHDCAGLFYNRYISANATETDQVKVFCDEIKRYSNLIESKKMPPFASFFDEKISEEKNVLRKFFNLV
jgi:hypothetical protein